jgi:hypothetical protein
MGKSSIGSINRISRANSLTLSEKRSTAKPIPCSADKLIMLGDDYMELMQAIRERRTILAFRSEPVSSKLLNEVIEVGSWAPSLLAGIVFMLGFI